MPSDAIRFGTDGWRGVIARDFTFGNVARVAQAIAYYLKGPERMELDAYRRWGIRPASLERGVLIGYDTRFMAREFAEQMAHILLHHKIPVYLSTGPVPTPALSYAVVHQKAALGLMITASHNPPQYLGVKIKTELGSAAPPEITQVVEKLIPERTPKLNVSTFSKSPSHPLDLKPLFLHQVSELIQRDVLLEAPLRVVIDAMYGSARGYIASLLNELKIPYVTVRHGDDPYFGGRSPEPVQANLTPLKAVLMAEKARHRDERFLVGLVTDGDGDRVAAMDEQGNYVDPHRCYALLFEHLWARGWRGKAVKSFALSDMATRIAERHSAPIDEVPVGFKFICEKLLTDDVLIGGEESGGIAIKNHIPERDGVLMALLLLEIVASQGKPLSQIVEELMNEIGHHYYERRDLNLEERMEVIQRLKAREPEVFAGRRVQRIEALDGIKLRFDDGWLLFRASGTEPLLRIYCEMDQPEKVTLLLDEAERFARGELELWMR
ncbi:MAG: hypothetical protein A2Z21_00250 [Candidatus Fraserbacteria bacterium RBG_16_55_9]|uniref:Phosphoglucosamine mutase n=1 Tax=Fraserbacteria sp. (strain RBG_16_55_9) TaxID=1817864 RepID=A0A1F5UNU4_FRAXR|nr:MAG: hypothetical protein A2Z21_00250 [Candidatus Fraserbacteria bacterium RBG_16_55_9]